MADQTTPLKTPNQAATEAFTSFVDNYENEVAIAIKESWKPSMMKTLGFPEEPTDAQFKKWAKELIDSRDPRRFTHTENGKTATIKLEDMQAGLDSKAKEKLRTTFGTDNLHNVILTREQLNASGEQIAQARFNHTGTSSFLQGATFGDALMGFIDWVMGLFNGTSEFSMKSIGDCVKKRATSGMAADTDQLLAQNVPSLHPGMRKFISTKVKETGEQETGLAPKVEPRVLKDVPLGKDTAVAPVAPITGLTGDPAKDIPKVVDQVSTKLLSGVSEEKRADAEKLKPAMSAAAVKVILDNKPLLEKTPPDFKALSEKYADELLKNGDTVDKLKKFLGKPTATSEELKPLVAGMMEMQFSANRDNLIAAATGKKTSAPDTGAPPKKDEAKGPNPIAVGIIANQIAPGLKEQAGKLAMLAEGKLADDNYNAIATAAAVALTKHSPIPMVGDSNATLKKMAADDPKDGAKKAYDTVSNEIFAELKKKQTEINKGGLKFDDARLKVLADRMAVQYIADQMKNDKDGTTLKDIPPAFAKEMNERAAMAAEPLVRQKLDQNLDSATVNLIALGANKKINAADIKNAVAPELAKIATESPAPDEAAVKNRIKDILTKNDKLNLPNDIADTMAGSIAKSVKNPDAPAEKIDTKTLIRAKVDKDAGQDIDTILGMVGNSSDVKDRITTALNNLVENDKNFSSKDIEGRREAIKAAIDEELQKSGDFMIRNMSGTIATISANKIVLNSITGDPVKDVILSEAGKKIGEAKELGQNALDAGIRILEENPMAVNVASNALPGAPLIKALTSLFR